MDIAAIATLGKSVLEALSYLATIFGLPIAIYAFYQAKKKEAQDREYGTYNSLDEHYIEFVNLALSHVELDVFEVPLASPPALNAMQKQQQLAAYTILMALMERAFLMYVGQSDDLRRQQWRGWEAFMRAYAGRKSFQDAWRENGSDFDTRFLEYMNHMIAAAPRAVPAPVRN